MNLKIWRTVVAKQMWEYVFPLWLSPVTSVVSVFLPHLSTEQPSCPHLMKLINANRSDKHRITPWITIFTCKFTWEGIKGKRHLLYDSLAINTDFQCELKTQVLKYGEGETCPGKQTTQKKKDETFNLSHFYKNHTCTVAPISHNDLWVSLWHVLGWAASA